ncbi:MAG: type II toxin-antitoxin system MqsA family antitoxin [Chloroflexi bacterium]|nr:type II toxin-antitoxin system MqsA family antitoxin [Chloroflexota bacterium]
MTGKLERNSRCPLCGGLLGPGVATIPFLFPDTVVLIKDVPAEICGSCHEPYMAGRVTDKITNLLNRLRAFRAEVSIISFSEPETVPA